MKIKNKTELLVSIKKNIGNTLAIFDSGNWAIIVSGTDADKTLKIAITKAFVAHCAKNPKEAIEGFADSKKEAEGSSE